MKSVRRLLKCDGLLLQKMNTKGEFEQVTPSDVSQMKACIDANRILTTPFDYLAEGKTAGFSPAQVQDMLQEWAEAGATWWVERLWETPEQQAAKRLR
ncbi:MAG: hypothetical protein WAV05_10750 [Anaerolineales bacterium]